MGKVKEFKLKIPIEHVVDAGSTLYINVLKFDLDEMRKCIGNSKMEGEFNLVKALAITTDLPASIVGEMDFVDVERLADFLRKELIR